jgi:hypothetical protein
VPNYQEDCNLKQAQEQAYAPNSPAPGLYAEQCAANAGNAGYSPEYVIEQLFTYRPANPSTGPKYEAIREAAKYFAKVLLANVPAGSDRASAILRLREAVMIANAGIALDGLNL